ncbi:hypothetical protein [Anaerococcus rubeinfantis]|uniref:hypothetical protein n=1 Tax=Anaerococcus rubeinfantis TaxID=1720199 RepID=UPI00073F21A9|nr:hypothetical protein [Anaerococcus rubeinfantis]
MTKKQGKLALYIGQIAIQAILLILIGLFLAKIKSLSELYQSIQLAGNDIEKFLGNLGFGLFKYINNFKDMISYMGFIKFLFFVNLILLLVEIFIFKANLYEYVFSAASCGLMLISYILIHPLISFLNLAKNTLKGVNFMNPDFSALSGIEEKFENLAMQGQNLILTFSPGRAKFAEFLLVLAMISFVASIYFLIMAVSKKKYENVNDVDIEAVKESFKGSFKEAKKNLANASEGLSKKLREDENSDENIKSDFSNEEVKSDEDFGKTRVLNRDEILNKSFDKKENQNKTYASGEVRHGAYDFSSGFKKNYPDDDKTDGKDFSDSFENNKNDEKISYENEDESSKNEKNYTEKLSYLDESNNDSEEKNSFSSSNEEGSLSISKENQKKYIFIGLGILGLVILFFLGKFIYFSLQADAEFNTSGVDIKFDVNGYSGYAKASASTVGSPILSQYKNKFLKEEIEEAYSQKITLDKEKNIKNGDEITATVEYTALPPYKISFTDDKIQKKFKVKGLDKFINSYDDINEDNVEKFEGDIQKEISDRYLSDGSYFSTKTKNLEIELAGLYEKKVPKEDLEKGQGGLFSLVYIYKINYDEVHKDYNDDGDEVEKTKAKETFVVYEVSNIIEQNGAIDYNIQQLYSDIDQADAVNKIKFDGYKEVNLE